MHISEGVLNAPVLITGIALTAAGVAVGIKKMDTESMPKIAVLTAAFFVASLIHIPVGFASVHLVLNGLVGILFGWAAFPAILVALALQAMLFQFGGITTLGINTFNMAFPAVMCFFLFRRMIIGEGRTKAAIAGFLCGVSAIALSAVLVALSLTFTDRAFFVPAMAILAAHVPVMIIEGIVTAFCIDFLKKMKSELVEV
ncbi:MAG: cobalt transporter CbiM [Deltaproteobacteria bacterium]|nr:cobalt transporter CbiM [Deltaproteobacteria bacterium]